MSVYNDPEFLESAIESVLNQSYGDFEFIIINDGSTDQSTQILENYRDPRIRLITNSTNKGLAYSLNIGIKIAQGEYLARMDSDDTSLPQRFEKQVRFLDKNPEVGLLGTQINVLADRPLKWPLPKTDEMIRAEMIFTNPFVHSSVCIRADVLRKEKLRYNPSLGAAQDYEFWQNLLRVTRVANLTEPLVAHRVRAESVSSMRGQEQLEVAGNVRRKYLETLSINLNEEELAIHERISRYEFAADKEFIKKARHCLEKIWNSNQSSGLLWAPALGNVLERRWFMICKTGQKLGLDIYQIYRTSFLSDLSRRSPLEKAKFFIFASFANLGNATL